MATKKIQCLIPDVSALENNDVKIILIKGRKYIQLLEQGNTDEAAAYLKYNPDLAEALNIWEDLYVR